MAKQEALACALVGEEQSKLRAELAGGRQSVPGETGPEGGLHSIMDSMDGGLGAASAATK